LENPGCKVTLYLRGHHLDVLRRFNCAYADAIRRLIELAAASQAAAAPPSAPAPAPTLCERCDRIGVPSCLRCCEAWLGSKPSPPAQPEQPGPAILEEKKPEAPALCERCARDFGVPVCNGCREAFYGANPPPVDMNLFLCERCQRHGYPNCRDCKRRLLT
jgi:hypothetical protein